MPISAKDAQWLAYYSSPDGIGLLAPRGWHCEGVSGSGGYAIFLSPKPIHHETNYDDSGWKGLEGAAIEINHITAENSGRYEIAEIMGRVFPEYRAFAVHVMKSMDLAVPAGPFPKDTVVHRGKRIIEYSTPAQTDGLGNFHSWIGKSDLPIRGVAVIIDNLQDVVDGPDLLLLSVRVPPDLASLIPVIVGQIEREVVGKVGR